MLKILISGALGHMGQAVAELAAARDDMTVVGGVDARGNAFSGATPVLPPVFQSFDAVDVAADVIIDFSHPSALEGMLAYAMRQRVPVVLATTGYSDAQRTQIREAARHVALFQSANMSYGVNVLCELAHAAATALGDGFDVEIIERHHRRKIDAPSGTALMLAEALAEAYPEPRERVLNRPERHQPRGGREIGIVSVRGGTVPGEHEVGFYGEDEVITLTHAAQSRRLFAAGALRAAAYVADKQNGLYNMQQLLLEQSLVTHVGVGRDVAIVALEDVAPGEVAALFRALRAINIDMINQGAVSAPDAFGSRVHVSFSLPQSALAQALAALHGSGGRPRVREHLVKLTVSGEGMAHASGVASRVFDALTAARVDMQLITTSETKISVCVDAAAEPQAVAAIRAEFGL